MPDQDRKSDTKPDDRLVVELHGVTRSSSPGKVERRLRRCIALLDKAEQEPGSAHGTVLRKHAKVVLDLGVFKQCHRTICSGRLELGLSKKQAWQRTLSKSRDLLDYLVQYARFAQEVVAVRDSGSSYLPKKPNAAYRSTVSKVFGTRFEQIYAALESRISAQRAHEHEERAHVIESTEQKSHSVQ